MWELKKYQFHPYKGDKPVLETDFGIDIYTSNEHLQKAQSPIWVTEEGILNFINREHNAKQSLSILKSLLFIKRFRISIIELCKL